MTMSPDDETVRPFHDATLGLLLEQFATAQ